MLPRPAITGLVQQQRLELPGTSREQSPQGRSREPASQRLHAQTGGGRLQVRRKDYAAELPRVAEEEPLSVVQRPDGTRVGRLRRMVRGPLEPPAHAKVHEQAARAVQVEHDELPPAGQGRDPCGRRWLGGRRTRSA